MNSHVLEAIMAYFDTLGPLDIQKKKKQEKTNKNKTYKDVPLCNQQSAKKKVSCFFFFLL
jgi:hypothetical protein